MVVLGHPQSVCLHCVVEHRKTRKHFHASSGNPALIVGARAIQDQTHLKPCGLSKLCVMNKFHLSEL